jgi:hypothetical protein
MQTKDLPNVSMQDYQISPPRSAYAAPYGKAILQWTEYTITSPVSTYNEVFQCEIPRRLIIKEFTCKDFVITGYGLVLARTSSYTQTRQLACNILAALDGGISVFSLENC